VTVVRLRCLAFGLVVLGFSPRLLAAEPVETSPSETKTATAETAAPETASSEDGLNDLEKEQAAEKLAAEQRARRERDQPRSELPDPIELPAPPKWERRLELGVDIAYVSRPFADALVQPGNRYENNIAWGLHLHWDVLPWLRFHPYFIDAHHDIVLPPTGLATGSSNGISSAATITDADGNEDISVATFVFGAKLAPTLALSSRARGWISAGVGWGRFEFPLMVVTEPNSEPFEIRERAGVFVEVPIGIGVSFDVIERWLAIEYEASAAVVFGQSGDAHENFQAIDVAGEKRQIGPYGAIEGSFVQTLGLSLIL